MKPVSEETLKEHCQEANLWVAIHGKVYDLTEFTKEHPGGPEILLEHAGMDATITFDDIGHSQHAHEMMGQFLVGELMKEKPKTAPLNGVTKVDQTTADNSCIGQSTGGCPLQLCKHFGKYWIPISMASALLIAYITYQHYLNR